jgi:hypothetical protein
VTNLYVVGAGFLELYVESGGPYASVPACLLALERVEDCVVEAPVDELSQHDGTYGVFVVSRGEETMMQLVESAEVAELVKLVELDMLVVDVLQVVELVDDVVELVVGFVLVLEELDVDEVLEEEVEGEMLVQDGVAVFVYSAGFP